MFSCPNRYGKIGIHVKFPCVVFDCLRFQVCFIDNNLMFYSTTDMQEDRNEDAVNVTDPVDSCKLENHFLVLDEKIGEIYKYCRVVQQEIKHVLADLKNPNRRRHERFDSYNDGCSTSYGFNLGDFSSGGDHHPIIDAKGEILSLILEAFKRHMYLHQLNGFQFLWKNIGGATLIEDIKTPLLEDGSRCIISHAPGTGKTYLTIVFLLTFMKVHPTCHPMIIAPLTMLRSWADEIKRWKIDIPFHNLINPDSSSEENVIASIIIQQSTEFYEGQKTRQRLQTDGEFLFLDKR
ncbi:hypothetical protein M9H77_25338 [Catharanthus roseus]|uniref:Uncharacterized protein n=1 Tax=Catharanthus roseus TaxID=4058 RepID=A0ACC0A6M8_CATRO|nr:hypothetical protein M9H77_25338 [Catharanthus roseus]